MTEGTLILKRSDVAALLSVDECIEAVEHAFRLKRTTAPPVVLSLPVPGGGFHIKAAVLQLDRLYMAAKTNANFPDNPTNAGLPTIQGTLVLCDAQNGRPLALMDSIEITAMRTGAATAVATKHLARTDAEVWTLCGCGAQGLWQLRSVARVRTPRRIYTFDTNPERAQTLARTANQEFGGVALAVDDLEAAVRESDICITCTPSRKAFLKRDWVRPGTFVAAVGADSHTKQEIEPDLLANAVVVVDDLAQCLSIGDLHHAVAAGVMRSEDVCAELGDIVSGHKPGRRSPDDVIVFDSTGTALQDVAAAAAVYAGALQKGYDEFVNLNELAGRR